MKIARAKQGIVINADAMQVYARWRILTARPTAMDESKIPHALFGHVGDRVQYSVGNWLDEIREVLNSNNNLLPVIVGGTGLYFHALTEGLADIPTIDPQIREAGRRLLETHGKDLLAKCLLSRDPKTAEHIDCNNPARLLRAWEVLEATGKGLKAWQDETAPPLLPLTEVFPLLLQIHPKANALRILARINQMMRYGLLEECADALPNWDPELPSAKAIGASEFIAYLQGMVDQRIAIKNTATSTRQYAKRQLTWFRSRMHGWKRINSTIKFGDDG